MVDDDCERVTTKQTYDTHLVTGAEVGIVGYGEEMVGDIDHFKVARIVEQTYVYTAAVR